METTKFEKTVFLCLAVACFQLMFGNTDHGFFILQSMIVLLLMGIMEYLKFIYLDRK